MESEYSKYVGMMYERGFYLTNYTINIMSEEVYCFENKILINPITSENDKYVYVFTGNVQKRIIPSEITEFRLTLEDERGEFKDNDNITLSVGNSNGNMTDLTDLYTRSYAQFKFGVQFDKGIHIDSDKFLVFQTQKEITKLDIEIRNIDLFVYKHRRRKDDFSKEMIWIE